MILVSLIGEQPIPNLLPLRFLKPEKTWLVYSRLTAPQAERLQRMEPETIALHRLRSDPYHIEAVRAELAEAFPAGQAMQYNLTGGTKPMALAAFLHAQECSYPFVYLQSENNRSLLYAYEFRQGRPNMTQQVEIPEIITASDYLNVHLPGYTEDGPSKDEGGAFEQALAQILRRAGFEVLVGVRPLGVQEQIEIDLVIRWGNRVGIAEVKLADREGIGPKHGIDQLTNAGGREYLGTYTTRFLITARRQSSRIRTLAQQRAIQIIEFPGEKLSSQDQESLVRQVKEALLGPAVKRYV